MKALLLVLLTFSTTAALFGQMAAVKDSKSQASSAWSKLVDSYFDDYFKLYPTQGTATGFHQYDSDLEDYCAAASIIKSPSRRTTWVDWSASTASHSLGGASGLPVSRQQPEIDTPRTGRYPQLGEESGSLFQRAYPKRFCDHVAHVRAAGEATAVSDRAREKDAGSSCGGEGESQEPAPNLHRSCDSATAGDRWLFPKGCARGLQRT